MAHGAISRNTFNSLNFGRLVVSYKGGSGVRELTFGIIVNCAGAIYMESGTILTVYGATFTGNEALAGGGGGVFCGNEVLVTLTGANFISNQAEGGGGLALLGVRQAVIENCLFQGNTGTDGGGLYTSASVGYSIIVLDCVFSGNVAGARLPAATTSALRCSSFTRS